MIGSYCFAAEMRFTYNNNIMMRY